MADSLSSTRRFPQHMKAPISPLCTMTRLCLSLLCTTLNPSLLSAAYSSSAPPVSCSPWHWTQTLVCLHHSRCYHLSDESRCTEGKRRTIQVSSRCSPTYVETSVLLWNKYIHFGLHRITVTVRNSLRSYLLRNLFVERTNGTKLSRLYLETRAELPLLALQLPLFLRSPSPPSLSSRRIPGVRTLAMD